ncbi:MAG: PIN domain-containing protein [Verrucomicrobiales bacterium]
MSGGKFHLDTSVVMRLLVGAPLDQFRAASRFLEERVAGGAEVAVGDIVLAEAYFALQSAYSLPKGEAISVLAQFSTASGIAVSDHAREALALPNLARAKPGFVDRLIHGEAAASGATLVSFEKTAARLAETIVLG